jgi:3-methyladenine DNA glycosylase AlkD
LANFDTLVAMLETTVLFDALENGGDKQAAIAMSAYMRNQFAFLGIATPKRKALCRDFLKSAKKEPNANWDFINLCWQKPYREFQYIAVDYLSLFKEKLNAEDMRKIKNIAVDKSWWDTIDGLDRVAGAIALRDPTANDILLTWSIDDNFWLRRIAIDHQLDRKDKTNVRLLEQIIINNFWQKEFFINKAIGWSLREYSKTNPTWVRAFIKKHGDKMSNLSVREASKYI